MSNKMVSKNAIISASLIFKNSFLIVTFEFLHSAANYDKYQSRQKLSLKN